MRNHLCDIEGFKKSIEIYVSAIERRIANIKLLKKDIKNGIERYPRDNKSIIAARYAGNFNYRLDNLIMKYSIGEHIDSLVEDFEKAIDDLENIGKETLGILTVYWMIGLGILLETDQENMRRLGEVVKRKNIHDFMIDYLLCASDIGWTVVHEEFDKEVPYIRIKEIIELAESDKEAASKKLHIYMDKEWLRGHSDYGWTNAHKEVGYIGFWSFETAAIAKILGLDDTGLKENIHYPYDLRHYKNTREFKEFSLKDYLIEPPKEEVNWLIGIENNPALEEIIPGKWHALVDAMISDYRTLDDDQFYEKYKEPMEIHQIWFYKDEFKEANKAKDMLGTLIVYALTQNDYILQLDYKEDFEDYALQMKNYWPREDTKFIQFHLEDDQAYYALVPKNSYVENVYEVGVQNLV